MTELRPQYPDVARALNNALTIRKNQYALEEADRARGFRNALSGYQPGTEEGRNILKGAAGEYPLMTAELQGREMEMQQQESANKLAEIKAKSTVILAALKARNPDEQQAILSSHPDTAGMQLTFSGPEVEFTDKDGRTMKGPSNVIASALESQSTNPEIWANPDNAQRFKAAMLQNGVSITEPENKPQSSLAKLMQDRDQLPPGDPRRSAYDAAITKASMPSSTKFEVGPDGTVSFTQGQGAGTGAQVPFGTGKGTAKTIETKMFEGLNQISRLDALVNDYDPRYLLKTEKFKAMALDQLESWNLKDLTPEQQQNVIEMSQYHQKALENLNRYIKEITGAQMSEAEAARLMKAMPDPGTEWWKGSGPTKFKAVLDSARKQARLAVIRYNEYLLRGIPLEEIARMQKSDANTLDLDQKELFRLMNVRGKKIEQELVKSGFQGNIEAEAENRLKKLYGI